MFSRERSAAKVSKTVRAHRLRSIPLKLLLAIVHAGSWMTDRPLPLMRPRMKWFMKGLDLAAALRTPGKVVWTDYTVPARDGGLIPVRLYAPAARQSHEVLPVILYFHGGGFSLGSHKVRQRYNRAWAALTGCIVLSVGYRLAPEHPYPRGVEDADEVLLWAERNATAFGGDGSRLAVAGESAGGNIAAVIALLARDRGGPALRCQALLYPAVDLTGGTTGPVQPSMQENGSEYMLTLGLLKQFAAGYATAEQRNLPSVSPLQAESMAGLPPSIVLTAELDPLRDQGHQYAQRLQADGVEVLYRCYTGMIHDFTAMMPGWIPAAGHSLRLAAAFVRERLIEDGAQETGQGDKDQAAVYDAEAGFLMDMAALKAGEPGLFIGEERWRLDDK